MKNLTAIFKLIARSLNPLDSSGQARAARYELLAGLVTKMGYRLYNKDCIWLTDQEYLDVWRGFAENNNRVHDRRFNLFNLAKSVRSMAGDTAECGSFHGAGSYLILSALQDEAGLHHIFDSFEGLSMPGDHDMPDAEEVINWQPGDLGISQQVVESNLSMFAERLKCYAGWIPERFGEVSDRQFKLVHIDVDLYQPTRDAIEFFYPRLVEGGLLICDDYGYATCPGAHKAMNDFFAQPGREAVVHLTTGTGFIIKRG